MPNLAAPRHQVLLTCTVGTDFHQLILSLPLNSHRALMNDACTKHEARRTVSMMLWKWIDTRAVLKSVMFEERWISSVTCKKYDNDSL